MDVNDFIFLYSTDLYEGTNFEKQPEIEDSITQLENEKNKCLEQGIFYLTDSREKQYRLDVNLAYAKAKETYQWLSQQKLPRTKLKNHCEEVFTSFSLSCNQALEKSFENRSPMNETEKKLSLLAQHYPLLLVRSVMKILFLNQLK